ncbi:MAG: bifunctional phosphopantothenoylcysteine decarboxylase/phosphopantothenate--cysteine ligase CoaBC [Aquificota bacterium]|nr:bifunctional phosphopantothenoylcysteine decarboxylase/phosphopantothenate--cysteine ligase CoaBC [Aquificota bacterium]
MGRRVLVGVTGGIAVYKVCDLVRDLRVEGFEVRVLMTPFAERFVGRLTFETLTGNRVLTDWEEDPLAHINLARWAEVFLIAPCTVNTLSKIALGIGDNLLTTTVLAYDGPLLIAPASNTVMWKSPPVRENLIRLRERGVILIEPEWGVLACEEEGEGKLAGKERLKDWIHYALSPKRLKGKKVLITCGATREPVDPVRFISNSSSGEMGFSLARVMRWEGAEVKVVAGFTTAEEPPEVEIVRVRTHAEMREEVIRSFEEADIVIMNAAVSDFRPKEVSGSKIKKGKGMVLELEETEDILAELGKRKKGQFLVGFALETEDIIENARKKLVEKNLDMIVANPADVIGSKHHRGYLITGTSREEFSFPTKLESARFIVERIVEAISS